EDNRIFQFASVGEIPQDKKFAGEQTRLELGDRNVVREFVTIHRGTAQDESLTRAGNDNLFMAYTHIAHDCFIGNNVILSNGASLAGHVRIEDHVVLGGFTLVHQFCSLGAHSFSAMGSAIAKDVPPYVTVSGNPARPHGINTEGLKRRGFSPEALRAIKQAYKLLYLSNLTLEQAVESLGEMAGDAPEIATMVTFLESRRRSIVR
ncbi:MAG: acyl-ACP--UDP-N-acetylglucosamine O-acyltransferase, partial [Pseudomonadota bacterium]